MCSMMLCASKTARFNPATVGASSFSNLETVGKGNADASGLAGKSQFIVSERNVFQRLTEFFEEEQLGGCGGVGSPQRMHRLAGLHPFV